MKKIKYVAAVGRRKTAIARVRLIKGKEPILINGQESNRYFPGSLYQKLLLHPLELAGLKDKYSFSVRVVGSGCYSQLLAVVHGLSRALVILDETHKPQLKKAGYLRRDPRKRQRRMVGTGGKSRRQKQSPKR